MSGVLRNLPVLAPLRGEQDDRHTLQRVGLAAVGGFERLGLLAGPVARAGGIFTGEWHALLPTRSRSFLGHI